MRTIYQWPVALLMAGAGVAGFLFAQEAPSVFQDDFKGKLGEGWSWRREHREAWRVSDRGLEVRLEPGNMWGASNDAKNVLIRPAPDPARGEVDVSVQVANTPTNQYEQVDLVWYYDDSNMVKLGEELVDGKLSIVMGREQQDKTRTIAIIPLASTWVRLRLRVNGSQIRGQYQTPQSHEWQEAGTCDSPAPANAAPKISLQFYQGPADSAHWARVSEFRLTQKSNP